MIKIYVAGKMSDPECINFLENVRLGQRAATELILLGYAPFCQMLDFQYFLQLRDGEKITREMIQRYSLEFLPGCDAMLVLPGYETSEGTKQEIERAEYFDIPVFYGKESLKKWCDQWK